MYGIKLLTAKGNFSDLNDYILTPCDTLQTAAEETCEALLLTPAKHFGVIFQLEPDGSVKTNYIFPALTDKDRQNPNVCVTRFING